MKTIALAVLFMLPSIASAKPALPRADVVYHTAFFNSGGKQWDDAPITSNFSAKTLSLIPLSFGKFMMIGIDCKILNSNGKLADCNISTDPKDADLLKAAQKMAKEIKIDHNFVRLNRANIKFISFQIRASNSNVSAISGPCWPPGCTPVLPPPPPPPQSQ